MGKGGMQSSGVKGLYCKCGKMTSCIVPFSDGVEISIHFGKKKTYWHTYTPGEGIKRTFSKPQRWIDHFNE